MLLKTVKSQVDERGGQIANLNQAVAERDATKAEVQALRRSWSWRLTKPLRLIHYFISRLLP